MIPYIARSVKGWCRLTDVILVTKIVVNHQIQELEEEKQLWLCKKVVHDQAVLRKPTHQREWVWWRLIIVNYPPLKIDDVIIIKGKRYRIGYVRDHSQHGFCKYDAVEDYDGH